VLVTRASALEDAASMAVLCADKTGTLTQNKLHVHEIFPANDFNADEVLQYAALASKEENHDPIDIAILTRVRESHLSLPAAHVQKFIPFDPTRRHTAATLVLSGATTTVYKGAVDTILSITPLTEDAAQSVAYTVEDQAAHGFRSLAVALQRENASPRFVGFLTLFDAPRSDAAGLITQLAEEGVAVKMLTGDALPIATELGEALQLTSIISVKDPSLQTEDANGSEKIQHPAIERLVKNPHIGGLAEVFPADKFNVVKAYQEAGYIVGMTGDGVNDAPALRQAEVGIAVRNATDMAKGAASVVLTTDGLESILPLVREGRMVSQRILTWIVNKVSLTILKTAFVVFGFLLTGQFVIETLGIILVALISDFTK
ncbi:MAG TPA: HAD-IC family P-type ATPase, partial [Turneriella sp.]|nr:HAD-IC family P-type ATPase [Turneriella sp.]